MDSAEFWSLRPCSGCIMVPTCRTPASGWQYHSVKALNWKSLPLKWPRSHYNMLLTFRNLDLDEMKNFYLSREEECKGNNLLHKRELKDHQVSCHPSMQISQFSPLAAIIDHLKLQCIQLIMKLYNKRTYFLFQWRKGERILLLKWENKCLKAILRWTFLEI